MQSVTCYNYAYLDPTKPGRFRTEKVTFLFQPLYIGKGKNDRCLHGARALQEGRPLLTNKLLYKELVRLLKKGYEPVVVLFNDCTSSEDALSVEGDVIATLGRKGIEPSGILCNRALGGEIPDTTGLEPPIKGKKMKDVLSPEKYSLLIEKLRQPKTVAQKSKMVKTRRERGSYDGGATHPRAKTFTLISPSGEIFTVKGGLKKFCADNSLSWQTLYNNQNRGAIKVDRSKYKNTARLGEPFWNTIGWECRSTV